VNAEEGGTVTVSTVHVDQARHLGPAGTARVELCREAVVTTEDLQYVGHFRRRRWILSCDRIVPDGGASTDTAGDGRPLDRRTAFRLMGNRLMDEIATLSDDLEQLGTGPLIRVVLHGPTGAVVCVSVLLDEFVVGVTVQGGPRDIAGLPRDRAVRRADRAVSALADRVRATLGQPSKNPGGWLTAPPEPVPVGAETAPVPAPEAQPEAFYHAEPIPLTGVRASARHPDGGQYLAACRDAMTYGALHYLALYWDDVMLVEADMLDGDDVAQFPSSLTSGERRDMYRRYGREIQLQIAEFAGLAEAGAGCPVLRAVFDVEQGAIFYYRISDDRFLMAVTIRQNWVSQADDVAAALAATCASGPR
jgi:hypothetical protein